jgi:hypothetical protein
MEAGAMHSTGAIRSWMIGILVAWVVVFAASFIIPTFVPATGDGFVRGLNRLVYWFWFQAAAFVLAIAAAWLAHSRRTEISRTLARFAFVPLLVAAAQIVLLASIIYWAR